MLRMCLAACALSASVSVANAAVLETFALDVTTNLGTDSTVSLDAGVQYLISISGTFDIGSAGGGADAEYFDIPSTPTDDFRGVEIGVLINAMDIDWGPYNFASEYETIFTGLGSTINLTYNDTFYADNDGELTVTISNMAPIPLPAGLPLLAAGLGGLVLVRRRAS